MRALKIPENSEELMESGTYMVWANTTLLVELKEKITRQLFIVGRLIELTEVIKRNPFFNLIQFLL